MFLNIERIISDVVKHMYLCNGDMNEDKDTYSVDSDCC